MAQPASASAPARRSPAALPARLRALAGAERLVALDCAWRVFALSRLLVAAVAVAAATVLRFTGLGGPSQWDIPLLTHPITAWAPGGPADVVLSSLARWDAVWYLRIAQFGYVDGGGEAAFFPLYPLTVRLAGGAGSPLVTLLSAYAVSLFAFLVALYLFHRLVELELGPRFAAPALALLALFPAAIFFGAPYSESLFLAVTVGAFLAARHGRWAWVGVLAAAASAARPFGLAVLVPLAVLHFYGPRLDRPPDLPAQGLRPRYRLRAQAGWLALAPAGLVAFCAYLGLAHGDAFAFLHLQESRHHHLTVPFGGVVEGTLAAARALAGLVAHGTLDGSGARNLGQFVFLVFALVATSGVLRRLPAAYGIYLVCALVLPLTFPVDERPLESLHRYIAVLFPVFMWLALACESRRITRPVLAVSGTLLGVLTALFAAWQFVA